MKFALGQAKAMVAIAEATVDADGKPLTGAAKKKLATSMLVDSLKTFGIELAVSDINFILESAVQGK